MGVSGSGVGFSPLDWAYLFEPYSRQANKAVFDQCGVTAGTSLLGIGCGSGFAVRLAAERGAVVAGLDASAALLDIAWAGTRARTRARICGSGTWTRCPGTTRRSMW